MSDIAAVIQRKRVQLEKLKQDIATLEAAEALLASESEASAPPRPQAMAAVANVTDKSEKVASRFP